MQINKNLTRTHRSILKHQHYEQNTLVKCHMSKFVFVYIQIIDHRRVKYVVYIDGNLFSIDGILALNINLERRVGCTCVVHNLIA